MLVKNQIKPPTVEVFGPSGIDFGTFNEYEFNDFRIQIMRQKLKGYYAKYNGESFPINPDGSLQVWPKNFDLMQEQLCELLNVGSWE